MAAAATALELGSRSSTSQAALEGFGAAFGRVETIPVDGRDVSILLVKNPAGANEVLRTLTLEDGQLDLWLALNDRIADGRDVSWIWDADFELLAGRVRRVTCSGTRAEEMALRLKYAGVDAEPGGGARPRALAGLRRGRRDDGRPLYALPTYTALLELRDAAGPPRAWPGGGRSEHDDRRRPGDPGTTSSAAPTRADLAAVAGAGRGGRRAASSTSAAAPAASRSTWPPRGHEVTGARLRRGAGGRAAPARARASLRGAAR